MSLPTEVLIHAIRSTSNDVDAAKQIQLYESVRKKSSDRKRKAEKMMNDVERAIREMMDERICNHDVKKTHGDPSGNGDSSEECLICGEWIH